VLLLRARQLGFQFDKAEVRGFIHYISQVVTVPTAEHCPCTKLILVSWEYPHTILFLSPNYSNATCCKTYHIRHNSLQHSHMLNIASDTWLIPVFLLKRTSLSLPDNCMKR